MYRQIQIIGNIGQDAIINTHNGRQIINFSAAVTEKFKNADGVQTEKTIWFKCAFWREAGQSIEIAKYLKKGTKVFVQGTPDLEAYSNKEGKPAANFKIKIDQIKLLEKAPDKAAPQTGTVEGQAQNNTVEQPANVEANIGEDGLPF
jgi:single-strand DNA-binding protein